jgi:hypothetical protein
VRCHEEVKNQPGLGLRKVRRQAHIELPLSASKIVVSDGALQVTVGTSANATTTSFRLPPAVHRKNMGEFGPFSFTILAVYLLRVATMNELVRGVESSAAPGNDIRGNLLHEWEDCLLKIKAGDFDVSMDPQSYSMMEFNGQDVLPSVKIVFSTVQVRGLT